MLFIVDVLVVGEFDMLLNSVYVMMFVILRLLWKWLMVVCVKCRIWFVMLLCSISLLEKMKNGIVRNENVFIFEIIVCIVVVIGRFLIR